LSLIGRGSATRYEDIMLCMAHVAWCADLRGVFGDRAAGGGFVGAALPRRRWLALSLIGRGSAARYEDIMLSMAHGAWRMAHVA
jgi:hypothetical protein